MSDMKAEKPATGVLKQGDYGDSMWYYIQCDCMSEDCTHVVEVEADDIHVQVHLYSNHHSKWWNRNRWKQIWQILTQGYAEMQTTIVMNEQTTLNYSQALNSACKDVKKFRDERKAKS